MFEKAESGRDAFTFSLGGMTTIASFVAPTAIADDRLNKAWDERMDRAPTDRRSVALVIKDLLARYFAPGCCQAA